MRVALYIRVSTEEQVKEGYSIDAQINVLKSHFENKGYEIVNVYKDDGYSGKNIEDRPNLKMLLADSGNGLFDMVAVWRINRMSRKQLDFLQIIDTLEKNSVAFFSLSENIDASTPVGKLMLQILGSFAELERNQIIENVKMGMNERAEQGKWNGGIVLGYKSVNKQLIIDEKEATLVRYIFDLYINGKGYKAIANQLNKEGYKTKKNAFFAIPTIRTIIINPLYAGFIRFNQVQNWNERRRAGKNENYTLVQGEHEPIIDLAVWEKAKSMNEMKSHKPTKTFHGHFPLTTLLRCPMCGQGMIGHRTKNSTGEYLRYYQCAALRSKGSAVCKTNLVRADEAEAFVFKRIEQITSNPDLLEKIVGNVNGKVRTLKQPLQDQLEYIQEQLLNIERNIKRLIDVIVTTDNPPSSVVEKLGTLEDEKKKLIETKKDTEYELNRPTIKEVSFEQVHQVLMGFSMVITKVEPVKQKDLLHSIINKITVNVGNNPDERSVKDIELFFDASINNDFVLTYGTVHSD
ncbi:recombinase family protein [Paenibacillus sp. FSL W7-1088]|uniref:recombinase family protein n=1 Tax=Paenibacillus sp. FSL W7-1088 TaxID=2921695 RepID=UPI0030EC8C8C